MFPDDFKSRIDALGFSGPVAVAVSGGPDSMALGYAITHWTDLEVHVLSVDHGLRTEAADEVAMVGRSASQWGARFHALKWEHEALVGRVQETARKARYELMISYCKEQGVEALFLGHHMDDQAETFLFRLAKGSGLDGLSGMRMVQKHESGIKLVRPFLGVEKDVLIEVCAQNSIPYINDPSNESAAYARVRLRHARAALEAEGLSAKRLSVTAARLARAREALEYYAQELYVEGVNINEPKRIVFNFEKLRKAPEDVVFRCIQRAVGELGTGEGYGPRMEKLEGLVSDLLEVNTPFRTRTLGGLMFTRDDQNGVFFIEVEKV